MSSHLGQKQILFKFLVTLSVFDWLLNGRAVYMYGAYCILVLLLWPAA